MRWAEFAGLPNGLSDNIDGGSRISHKGGGGAQENNCLIVKIVCITKALYCM